MTAEGHKVTSLQGALEPAERDRVMDDFKNGKTKVLITTNVLSRGIDVLQVNMVIKWAVRILLLLPEDAEFVDVIQLRYANGSIWST